MQRSDIEFMFRHFVDQAYDFPRRIATFKSSVSGKIQSGGQFPVNSIDSILSSFARADYKECRLGGYPYDPTDKLQQTPTLLFIDIDTLEKSALNKALRRMRQHLVISQPTIIMSGRGYHIIQPLDVKKFFDTPAPAWFLEAQKKGWRGFKNGVTNEFLKWAEEFLSGKKADVSHTPTIKSFLLRPPGTINAKWDKEVTVVQAWDGKKPPIDLLLGEFYSAKLREYNEHAKRFSNSRNPTLTEFTTVAGNYYDSYIPIILETSLPDWREHILSLEIIPYLSTVKQLADEQVYQIAEDWLQRCDKVSPLRFDYSIIWNKIRYTKSGKRVPMGKAKLLQEMFVKSPEAHLILQPKLSNNYAPTKGGDR